MRNHRKFIFPVILSIALLAVALSHGPVVSSQDSDDSPRSLKVEQKTQPGLANFDIRIRQPRGETQKAPDKQLALETPKLGVVTSKQAATTKAIIQSIRASQERLASRLPNLKVQYNEVVQVPEIVGVDGGVLSRGVAPLNAGKQAHEYTLKNFLRENAGLYGLTPEQVDQLVKVSDYTNPVGNLSFVEYQQEVNGIPVFQGYVRGILTSDGRLARTTGLLAPSVNSADLAKAPSISANRAVALAAGTIRVSVDEMSLTILESSPDGLTQKVSPGPFDDEVKVSLVYFPLAPGQLVLAYAMTLWQPDTAYYVVVDAQSGKLLWRKNISQDQDQSYTYNVYDNDSPTPSAPVRSSLISTTNTTSTEPQPPGISRTDLVRISEGAFNNLGWIPNSAGASAPTTGNNVDAGLDIAAPNGIDPAGRATATNFVFKFDYRPDGSTDPTGSNSPTDAAYRMGAVTNLFFWTNRYHDIIYNYGFTEAARNFQTDNFMRGGLGGDAIRAEAQDSSGTNNANFQTPADGQPPRMQMYLWPGTPARDGDLDHEVLFHEITHGTSNRLHANGSGLNSQTAGGMGEGWSDFYAISMLAPLTPDGDDGKRLYAMGAYDTRNYYRAIRRFPYAVKSALASNGRSHNPLTLADIDPAQIDLSDAAFPVAPGSATQVHNQGEVWASALFEVRALFIEKFGFVNGTQRVLQTVTDGMKLDPVDPTMLDGRDSILAANCAGFAGADELDIWDGFRIRGMGFRASTSGVHVTESFDDVNLRLGNVTATEVAGSSNGNGVIDPGETVRLVIPLTNILCAHNADNTTASILPGGGSANYGTVEAGNTETRTIDYTVPVNTACGAAIPITISVNSSLGLINYTYFLNVAQPSAVTTFETFDNVTAPALPAGWTTQRTGAGMPWATSTVNSDTTPNNAFSPNPTNTGTSELISPTFPVNTGLAQVIFRNLFNLEADFDGMTLQIKIGNGTFQDIIAAGGSFVSGGYTGETNDGAAWTGLSAGTTASPGYITTVVYLPPQANGENVQLKWRVFGDPNTVAPGQSGVRIDTIQYSTTADNCTPFGASNVSISGRVTENGVGLGGIQVTLGGSTHSTRTTASDGSYSFINLVAGGSYTVTPTSPNYEYIPPSRTYNNLNFDVTDANFAAIRTASISGRVTTQNGAQGIDGITITLTGAASSQTVTAGGGYYSFLNLTRGGNYTVTPSGGENNTFTPPSRTYNNLQGPITNADFTAVENLACNAIGSPVAAQIAAGDPTQSQRTFRGGTPSDCGGRPFPGYNADPAPVQRRYDQYTYVNGSANPICVKVTLRADNAGIHSAAYLGAFNPADVGQNYLGDLGVAYTANTEASYSFTVPAGATYVIVVHEITPNTPATINYTFVQCSTPTAPPPTPTPKLAQPGDVLITEFRQSVGSTTSSDEYVELYNNTDATISINGYALAIFNAAFGGDVFLGLPAGTTIPRRGRLIIANVAAGGYSLSSYAGPDLSHANANLMPDNQGFGLIDGSRTVMIDSVGFRGNGGNLPYMEGNGLTPTNGNRPNVQHAYVRKINVASGYPQDTGDNASDFHLVSVTAAVFNATAANGGPIQSILGAPGPENRTSPRSHNLVDALPLDPNGTESYKRLGCGAANTPPCNPNTSTFGWLSLRYKVTNNTGASLTRLRFRIIDITTLGSPGGGPASTQADLRAVTSTQMVVTLNAVPTTVEGTTVEQPATTPPMDGGLGGGLNNSLNVGTIALATPLLNGQTVNVQFLFGVQKSGNLRLGFLIEGLPGGGMPFGLSGSIVDATATPPSIKQDQTINFGALSDKTIADPDFSVSATATSGLPVSLSASGPCTVTPSTSPATVHITGRGTCTITASQAGDANFNPAPSVSRSFNIRGVIQTITFAPIPNKSVGDPDFVVSPTASSGLPVSLSSTGPCTVTSPSPGTVHITGRGTCTITASQPGDATYDPAPSVSQSFNIAGLAQTITFNALPDKTFGDPDFNVSATASSGLAVTFSASGNCTVTGSTVHLTGAGSCTITASQSGNSTYEPAPNVSRTFTIAKAATATAVSSTPNPSNLGQSVTFTATVTSAAGTPTGTVQFKDGGTNLGSPQALDGSGVATLSTSALTVGVHTITAEYSGDANFLTSTGTLSGGQTVGSVIQFSASHYNTTEGSGFTTITVQRIGDLSSAVTVHYATPADSSVPCSTANGVASPRCDFETAIGTLQWAAGDGADKTFTVLINQDSFVEGPETATLTLSNVTGGSGFPAPGATSTTATLTIADDVTEPATNPIDDSETFVRQHYRDFLNREGDPAGIAFWTNNIESCGANAACREGKRVDTSAAFFLSIEFRDTGYFVYRAYTAGFGPTRVGGKVPITLLEFLPDTQQIGRGVIIGQPGADALLEANKDAYMLEFVQRAAFVAQYPNSMTPAHFVDDLNANTGNSLTTAEEDALVAQLTANNTTQGRADVLRQVIENQTFQHVEFNRAFVLMQYFGYLRRNPNDPPDTNFGGYDFWLAKLNQFNGNYSNAEMVKAFINSIEYRGRFGN